MSFPTATITGAVIGTNCCSCCGYTGCGSPTSMNCCFSSTAIVTLTMDFSAWYAAAVLAGHLTPSGVIGLAWMTSPVTMVFTCFDGFGGCTICLSGGTFSIMRLSGVTLPLWQFLVTPTGSGYALGTYNGGGGNWTTESCTGASNVSLSVYIDGNPGTIGPYNYATGNVSLAVSNNTCTYDSGSDSCVPSDPP